MSGPYVPGQYPSDQTIDGDAVVPEPYPATPDGEILPSLPTDPVPNPEPEQPSLGVPDAGIFEGTGGSASLE